MAAVGEKPLQYLTKPKPSVKNIAKKSTTKLPQIKRVNEEQSTSKLNGIVAASSSKEEKKDMGDVNGHDSLPLVKQTETDMSVKITADDEEEEEQEASESVTNPAKVARLQIEEHERKQEEMIQTITGRESPVTTVASKKDTVENEKNDMTSDCETPKENVKNDSITNESQGAIEDTDALLNSSSCATVAKK